MATITKKIGEDWCHICGTRTNQIADIFYPENAENENDEKEYVRMCINCASTIIEVIKEGTKNHCEGS